MIGIICAMQTEVDAVVVHMEDSKQYTIHTINVVEGRIGKKDVIIAFSGIGKVNAAIASTVLCTNFELEALLNVGVAGGLHAYQHAMNVVLASKIVQHDFDVSPIDGDAGYGIESICDERLISICKEILENLNMDVEIGLIASGDQFVTKNNYYDRIVSLFPESLCAEMEGGPICACANRFGVPCLVIRSLSDVAVHEKSEMDYMEYCKKASEMAGNVLQAVIEKL